MKSLIPFLLFFFFATELVAQTNSGSDTTKLKHESTATQDSVKWMAADSVKLDKFTSPELNRIGTYKWVDEVLIRHYNLGSDYRESLMDPMFSRTGQKFNVIGFTKKGDAVIRFLDYDEFYFVKGEKRASKYHNLYNRDKAKRQIYFVVQPEMIDSAAARVDSKLVKGGLTFGVINFPFKWRPQNKGDFSAGFNFGVAVGYQFRHRVSQPWTFSLITGYSLSSITLDSSTTAKNQEKLKSTNNFSAFSFSLGGLVEYHKVQAGLFLGWDFLNRINQTEYDWTYHGKPWISIGIGLSVFSPQKVESAAQSTTQDSSKDQ